MRIKINTSEVPVLQVTLNSRLNLIDEFSYTEYYNSEHFLLQKLGYSYKKAQVQMKSKSITRSNKATNLQTIAYYLAWPALIIASCRSSSAMIQLKKAFKHNIK